MKGGALLMRRTAIVSSAIMVTLFAGMGIPWATKITVVPVALGAARQAASQAVYDFMRFEGTVYLPHVYNGIADPPIGRPLVREDLGPEFARIERLADAHSNPCDRPPTDTPGELTASTLAPEAVVYAVVGYDVRFRLATIVDGEVRLYEAACGPAIQNGVDLLDLSNLVRLDVRLNRSRQPAQTVRACEDDPAGLERLANLILTAPVVYDYELFTIHVQSKPPELWVVFGFIDGTATARPYYARTGDLALGIRVPEAFQLWTMSDAAVGTPPAVPERGE